MAEILSVGQFMFLKDIKGLLWLAIANDVRTAIMYSERNILIPKISIENY